MLALVAGENPLLRNGITPGTIDFDPAGLPIAVYSLRVVVNSNKDEDPADTVEDFFDISVTITTACTPNLVAPSASVFPTSYKLEDPAITTTLVASNGNCPFSL